MGCRGVGELREGSLWEQPPQGAGQLRRPARLLLRGLHGAQPAVGWLGVQAAPGGQPVGSRVGPLWAGRQLEEAEEAGLRPQLLGLLWGIEEWQAWDRLQPALAAAWT